jgi:hypothetical protein
MADAMKVAIDAEVALRALRQVGDRANQWISKASLETAERVADEMRRRVARSGLPHVDPDVATWTKIHHEKAKRGSGYVVMAYATGGSGSGGRTSQYHTDIWLERGTTNMRAQPFLWVSAELEQSAHLRRMQEAFTAGMDEVNR